MLRECRGALWGSLCLFYAVLPLSAGVAQQPPELVTDRPDQTESSEIVPRGFVQLELGATFTSEAEDGRELERFALPEALLRIGLIGDRLELRLGWEGIVDLDGGARPGLDLGIDGTGDAEIGFKLRLADASGARPATALLVSTSVPVGDDELTTQRYDPAVRLTFAHGLTERLDLGYNVGIEWESELGATGVTTVSRMIYTVALGIGLSERTGAFVELYGDLGGSAGGAPAHSFDGGFTFLLSDRLQFDLAGGLGLSEAADDWFAGLGLTVRWPR